MELKLTKIRPVWLLALVASTTGLLIYSLGDYNAPEFIRYFAYLFSAVVLVVVCVNAPRGWRYLGRKIRTSWPFLENRFILFSISPVRRYLTDTKLKHEVNLGISTIINFAFNIFRLGDGLMRGAVWEISLACYYLFLVIVKTTLLWNFRYFDQEGEQKIYRRSGLLLLGLAMLLIGMIIQMAVRPTGRNYNGNYMIYLVAAYSFYLIISAVVGMVKYRKSSSATLKVVKSVNLITASVSLLMLQTTMLATFGGDRLMIARMDGLTGAGVVILMVVIAVKLLRRDRRKHRAVE